MEDPSSLFGQLAAKWPGFHINSKVVRREYEDQLVVFDNSHEGQTVLRQKRSVRSGNQLEFRPHEPCGLDLRIDAKLCLLYARGQIVGDLSAGVLEIDCCLCGSL